MLNQKLITGVNDIDFVHIPKCAGSTLLKHFSTLDYDRFTKKDHQTALQMIVQQGREEFNRKFVFSVVRNPYDRFISIWQYDLRVNIINRFYTDSKKWNLYYDFNEWFKDRYSILFKLSYILPQYYWVHDWCGNMLVDHIWKIEEFDSCIQHLNEKLGTNFDYTKKINANPSNRFNYRNITTKAIKDELVDLCRIDCLNFGYEW